MYSPPSQLWDFSALRQNCQRLFSASIWPFILALSWKQGLFFPGAKLVQAMLLLPDPWRTQWAQMPQDIQQNFWLYSYFPFCASPPLFPLFKIVFSKGNVPYKRKSVMQADQIYVFWKARLIATFMKHEMALILKRIMRRKEKLLCIVSQ